MNRLLGLLSIATVLCACESTTSVGTLVSPATGVVVDPAQFLGDVACVDAPGGMQSYVATLFEVRGTFPGPFVPTGAPQVSAPTSCLRATIFQNVIQGIQYAATVEGYERNAVRPRWTTSCGFNVSTPVVVPARDSGTSDGGDGAVPRVSDGGLSIADAATPVVDGSTPELPICTPIPHPDGSAPPFEGPVCALDLLTITIRSCSPLVDHALPTR